MSSRATETVTNQPRSGTSGPIDRVTVNLNSRALAALDQVAELTGENKTDAINRALQVYALLHQLQADGGAIYTRERDAKELERLRIL